MAEEKISKDDVRKLLSKKDYDKISKLLNNNIVDLSPHYTDILFNVIVNDEIEIVRSLISKGADLNAYNEYGFTPLSWAIRREKVEIAQLLIYKELEINAEVNYSALLTKAVMNKKSEKLLNDQQNNLVNVQQDKTEPSADNQQTNLNNLLQSQLSSKEQRSDSKRSAKYVDKIENEKEAKLSKYFENQR